LKEDRRAHFKKVLGIKTTNDGRKVLSESDVCIFAVKPQDMPKLLAILAPAPGDKLLLTICAGISTGYMEKILSGTPRIIRAMPNTPMLVGAGVAAITRGKWATDDDMTLAKEIFSTAAKVVDVEERAMDAVTALSGSGPAYFFYLVEAMAEAGAKLGLSEEAALFLARETCLGAGKLMSESADPPAELRRKVTSPGGTTFAAITKMDEAKMKDTIDAAVKAAASRSKDMGL
jgi:pyrroline-5-carboxylate reductase